MNVKAPEDSLIENLSLSSPPEIDQVTVSLAENVPTEVRFSSMDMLLDKSPESPERPVISGATSSTSNILKVTNTEDELLELSLASTFTS